MMNKSSFVNIKGDHTYIITYGKWIDDQFDVENGDNEVIILIPGNPGFAEFYQTFAQKLYENTKTPVWVISNYLEILPTSQSQNQH